MLRAAARIVGSPAWNRQAIQRRTVVYGAFKGMGDLVCAAPVIASELKSGVQVVLLIFPFPHLRRFVDLLDFGPQQACLRVVALPVPLRLHNLREFARAMSTVAPDLVWYSPHSPRPVSSWRIPLLLSMIRLRYWPRARLAGADSERLSWLFDVRLPIDRKLPYSLREWTAYTMMDGQSHDRHRPAVHFVERLRAARRAPRVYDILIHPGAGTENRKWPVEHYQELLAHIPGHYRVGVLGLPADIAAVRAALPDPGRVDFASGSLEEAIATIARTRVVLTMDSGTMFFAQLLGVPVVALFGPSDPATVLEPGAPVVPIFTRQWPCQPCSRGHCTQKRLLCMHSIEPRVAASSLLRRLEEAGND